MKLSVRVDSATVERAFPLLGALVEETVRDLAVIPTLVAITARAKPRTRIRTGRLRNSIGWELDPSGLAGRAGSNLSYAKVQELGSSTQDGTFFMTQSFFEEIAPFERRLDDALTVARQNLMRGLR